MMLFLEILFFMLSFIGIILLAVWKAARDVGWTFKRGLKEWALKD